MADLRDVLEPRCARIARQLVVLAFIVMVAFWVRAVPSTGPIDYGEGDTATWAYMLRHGERIWDSPQGLPMHHTNYPPIQLELVAWSAPSDETVLVAGRFLSLLGFMLAMAAIGISVAAATSSRKMGLLAACLLAGTLRAGFWAVTCRGDALALGLGAFGVTVASCRLRAWPLIAAALFSLSLLTKHNLIALPLGLAGWALVHERRNGVIFVLATTVFVGGAVWYLDLFEPLVRDSAGGFLPLNLLRHLVTSIAPSGFAIGISVIALRRWDQLPHRAQRVLGPWAGVFVASCVWTIALGKIGADFNYVVELCAATTVLACVAVNFAMGQRLFAWHAGIVLVETLVWALVVAIVVIPARATDVVAARQALADVKGPVLSEQTWNATAAGHAPIVIPFLSTQLASAHRWDPTQLVDALDAGTVERVLLQFPVEEEGAAAALWHSERFPPRVLDAVRTRYVRVAHDGDIYIYKPR